MATRREELAEAATDYALEHGLIGLSLRPLAEALGTSDRMLLYHFRDKDDLVATILRTSAARSVLSIRALPASRDLRTAVLDLWRAVSTRPAALPAPLRRGGRARALRPRALRDRGPRGQRRSGCERSRTISPASDCSAAAARRAADLVDAAFMGLQLDQPLDSQAQQRRTVGDLADAVAARWGSRDD